MTTRTPTPRAVELQSGAIVADLLGSFSTDLMAEVAPFQEAKTSWLSVTVAVDDGAWPQTVFGKIAAYRHFFGMHGEQFILADSVDDILQAKRDGKLAISFNFQGTEPLGREIALIGAYRRLGVCSMLMAYNFQNNVGTGCIEAMMNDNGLSQFGRRVVKEMNRVGMFVDLSHSGFRTTMDAMEESADPCIFSHSNAHALYAHPRNIKDEQIKAVAATGGLIGINGVGSFVGEPHEVSPRTVFRHLDYMVQMVGADHVALGLDYMSPALCGDVLKQIGGDLAKVGMSEPPWAYLHPRDLGQVVELMLAAGYSDQAVKNILGENVIRLARRVWK